MQRELWSAQREERQAKRGKLRCAKGGKSSGGGAEVAKQLAQGTGGGGGISCAGKEGSEWEGRRGLWAHGGDAEPPRDRTGRQSGAIAGSSEQSEPSWGSCTRENSSGRIIGREDRREAGLSCSNGEGTEQSPRQPPAAAASCGLCLEAANTGWNVHFRCTRAPTPSKQDRPPGQTPRMCRALTSVSPIHGTRRAPEGT